MGKEKSRQSLNMRSINDQKSYGQSPRGFRDGTGPYSGGIGRRRRAGDICPFDEENIEDIKNMDFELNVKRKVKVCRALTGKARVVSDEIGKRRFIK